MSHSPVGGILCLPPFGTEGILHVVVETPRGSQAKLKFDPELGAFTLSKSLMLGLAYPYDWGFVPSTRADDGDPVDVLVIHDAATTPGVVLRCRPLGVLEVLQKEKSRRIRNDRIVAVPAEAHRDHVLHTYRDLGRPTRDELEKFLVASDALDDKKLEFLGWKGPRRAIVLVKDGVRSFRKRGLRGGEDAVGPQAEKRARDP
jgi:inorganic pyrophosphatase